MNDGNEQTARVLIVAKRHRPIIGHFVSGAHATRANSSAAICFGGAAGPYCTLLGQADCARFFESNFVL
jgi:hypothetical protein